MDKECGDLNNFENFADVICVRSHILSFAFCFKSTKPRHSLFIITGSEYKLRSSLTGQFVYLAMNPMLTLYDS